LSKKTLLEKVIRVVETVYWKHRYFYEDFQDYKLQRAAWREEAVGWFTQQDTKLFFISRSSTTTI